MINLNPFKLLFLILSPIFIYILFLLSIQLLKIEDIDFIKGYLFKNDNEIILNFVLLLYLIWLIDIGTLYVHKPNYSRKKNLFRVNCIFSIVFIAFKILLKLYLSIAYIFDYSIYFMSSIFFKIIFIVLPIYFIYTVIYLLRFNAIAINESTGESISIKKIIFFLLIFPIGVWRIPPTSISRLQ